MSSPWMVTAWAEFGQREIEGVAANPRIRALYRDAGYPGVTSDEVAWCAAYVGAILERSQFGSARSLLARSYLPWGRQIDTPTFGAVAVLTRGNDPGAGHVGFIVGATADQLFLLGGNQSDTVSVEAVDRQRLLSIRWPDDGAIRRQPEPVTDLFDQALRHVLEMEGGWSDDPFDPGGPTNRGITLATFASFTGRALEASTAAALTFELKTIKPELVAQIYRERYWAPSRAYEMSAPIALMHFDAAVNHGVGGAARLLQQVLDVEIDGDIGPISMGAAHAASPDDIIGRYAEARRARYRALPHFWRFGRGWLARVDRTLTASQSLARVGAQAAPQSPPDTSPASTHEEPMTSSPTPSPATPAPKWWGRSLTIWGAIITTLATVLPAIGPLIGIDVTAEMVRDIGEQATRVVQALGGLFGVVMTIYGRVRAEQPLSRQYLQFRL